MRQGPQGILFVFPRALTKYDGNQPDSDWLFLSEISIKEYPTAFRAIGYSKEKEKREEKKVSELYQLISVEDTAGVSLCAERAVPSFTRKDMTRPVVSMLFLTTALLLLP